MKQKVSKNKEAYDSCKLWGTWQDMVLNDFFGGEPIVIKDNASFTTKNVDDGKVSYDGVSKIQLSTEKIGNHFATFVDDSTIKLTREGDQKQWTLTKVKGYDGQCNTAPEANVLTPIWMKGQPIYTGEMHPNEDPNSIPSPLSGQGFVTSTQAKYDSNGTTDIAREPKGHVGPYMHNKDDDEPEVVPPPFSSTLMIGQNNTSLAKQMIQIGNSQAQKVAPGQMVVQKTMEVAQSMTNN